VVNTKPLRLVFCGTPDFAVPSLEALLAAGHEIALVVTQPDRPVGRKQIFTAPAVKQCALAHALPVAQPEKIKHNQDFRAQLESIVPDAIVVVAYGRIIPSWMLALPRLGCINLHGSLLPRLRGAAPIQWSLALGDTITGNTTMLLDAGLDTGPILLQQEMAIDPELTAVDLFSLLARAGAPLLVETLRGLANGAIAPRPQDNSQATLARILEREDGGMRFAEYTAVELWNRWRGFQPWPGAFTTWQGRKLIVHRLRPVERNQTATPGTLETEGGRIFVACAGESWLELVEVQLEGKGRIPAAEFLRGTALSQHFRLGE